MSPPGHFRWTKYASSYPKLWKEYTTFSVLRDPIDRFVSSYNFAKMDSSFHHTIDEKDWKSKHGDYDICNELELNDLVPRFVNGDIELWHAGWKTQYEWIVDNGSVAVDYLVLFEKVNEAMKTLAPKGEITTLNRSTYTSKREQLTEENIKLLSEYYDTDIDLFNQMEGEALCGVDKL